MLRAWELRSRIAAYLWGSLPLDDFDEWFSASTWNMHRDSNVQAQEMAAAVELLLAEHSSGHLTDDDLKAKLQPFADPSAIFISAVHVVGSTTSLKREEYSRFSLRHHRIERCSSQSGNLEETTSPPPYSTAVGRPQIYIDSMQIHQA